MSMTAEMREWLADLGWADDDPDDLIATASDADIERAINQHYDGGVPAFHRDATAHL